MKSPQKKRGAEKGTQLSLLTSSSNANTGNETFGVSILDFEIKESAINHLTSQEAFCPFCFDKLTKHLYSRVRSLQITDLSKVRVFNKSNNKIGIEILKKSRR